MISTTDLMKGHHILTEIVPDGHGRMVKRQVLFLRADKVVRTLQERNEHLHEVNERMAKVVERHKARNALLDQAASIIAHIECRCRYLGDGDTIECSRCQWLDDLKKEKARDRT